MTDKEKIRKETEKCYSDALERAKIFNTDYWEGKADAYRNVLIQLDSLQEEPVNRTTADIEAAMKEVEEKSRAFTEAHQGEDADNILAQMRGEEPVSNELNSFAEEYSFNIPSDIYNLLPKEKQALWIIEIENAIKAGAKWQKVKTLSDIKKAVTGKVFQFSMKNVEAWGNDSNGKTVTLKGRVTFQVSNPESIVDALIAELENDN